MTALPNAEIALVAALRGEGSADDLLAAVAAIRKKHPVGITDGLVGDMAAWAQGLRASTQPTTALHHLEQIQAPALRRLATLDVFDLAAQELRASGENVRRREVSTVTDLTAQERQVAALIRQGLSNRDAAARLFVSPRTVDFHLRNVFAKLGVASRVELMALPGDSAGVKRPVDF